MAASGSSRGGRLLVSVEVDGEPIGMSLLDAGANVWKGDYTLDDPDDVITIEACAAGLTGSTICAPTNLSARFMTAKRGVMITSADDRLNLRRDGDVLERDGYVLVLPAGRGPSGEALAVESRDKRIDLTTDQEFGLPGYRLSPEDPEIPVPVLNFTVSERMGEIEVRR